MTWESPVGSAGRGLARIAVAPRRFAGDADALGAWRRSQLFFEHALMTAIANARAIPVGMHLPRENDAEAFAETYADICDGLLLQGGTDVDRTLSHAPAGAPPDTERDRFELLLLFAFLRRDKAVLGICRGMQLINVARGGTLGVLDGVRAARHSDPARYGTHAHAIELASAGHLARLYGRTCGVVSSAHRQAVMTLGEELVVEARSADDGGIEAVRAIDARYLVGVQWHPELDDERERRLSGARLIEDFIAHAQDTRLGSTRTEAYACAPARTR
jgi:gamma-glutamyl-gamma-aminobutyrate hydrolase PuuD